MYDDHQLKEFRETFLKENRPTEYRQLQEDGELETHLEECAAACVTRAKSYIEQGVWENNAWRWAVRVVLLETPPD